MFHLMKSEVFMYTAFIFNNMEIRGRLTIRFYRQDDDGRIERLIDIYSHDPNVKNLRILRDVESISF